MPACESEPTAFAGRTPGERATVELNGDFPRGSRRLPQPPNTDVLHRIIAPVLFDDFEVGREVDAARDFSERIVRLPLWAGMTDDQVGRVLDASTSFAGRGPVAG